VKFNAKALCVMTFLGIVPGQVPAATSELVCRGDTYSVASGKKTAIKRFSRREITLTAEAGRTAIAFYNEKPMEADITESHYRATRSRQSGDWVLIMLNRETLDVTVSEFNTLPDQRHQSERFVGRCEINDPVALNL
jgi:hypothetical protein